MSLHQNSLRQWNQVVLPKLNSSQMAVYRAIQALGRANTAEVSDHMEVPLHTISGRFGELARKGYIEDVADGGSRRSIWQIKGEPRQLRIF